MEEVELGGAMAEEQRHFEETGKVIRENISLYEEKAGRLRKESEELFQAVARGETELYNQLMASISIRDHAENSLRKNRAALNKPYFGRIDFIDLTADAGDQLYIGKNGISREQQIIIVDWRAPVATVYYENEMGEGLYPVPGGEEIAIDLKLKRTFDIDEGRLGGFYDNDAGANDELLVKYLAKNKEAVLGDIISTIQKEQNEIIRDSPFKNVIVQGVAGSGKTTVAMHRISYILYNYSDRFQSNAFCIIGGSDMLLSYITSGLPELDVRDVKQMRMDRFMVYLLGKDWKKSWKLGENSSETAIKSRLFFIKALDEYLYEVRKRILPAMDIRDRQLGLILSRENIEETLRLNRGKSAAQTGSLLNERIRSRISFLTDMEDREFCRNKTREYKNYYDPLKGPLKGQTALMNLYLEFLTWFVEWTERDYDFKITQEQLKKGCPDIYDVAALVLIKYRITAKSDMEEFSQIIVDEAQDFGEVIYYVQKQVIKDCYFTIMGDVSQNINYDTGMNEWDALKEVMFDRARDVFRLLSKSYRNTIEISEFAGNVLEKASAGSYRIQPVIRHGLPVEFHRWKKKILPRLTQEILDRGYDTVAVICRNDEEADQVRERLYQEAAGLGDFGAGHGPSVSSAEEFRKGVMVLPIHQTKGLEFDAVILWKPDVDNYGENPREAKLLYVGITRALHELHLITFGSLSPLFSKGGGNSPEMSVN